MTKLNKEEKVAQKVRKQQIRELWQSVGARDLQSHRRNEEGNFGRHIRGREGHVSRLCEKCGTS